MNTNFSFSQFLSRFPSDDVCLDEFKRLRFPDGIHCITCNKVTKHYKLHHRLSYACTYCRHQVYPLAGTIFEKSSTPLRLWFYVMFCMTQTKADISIKQLQRELGVTYKTAWRMTTKIRALMEQNNADLLSGGIEYDNTYIDERGQKKVHKWVFFNKLEFKVVQKKGGRK